ncbi:hypothetical protein IU474_16715 [Nocardia otitidiscaviarum]|uniref:hypothetical protein n=1 Tax=Nocardia otitidiscaviarum TaxID=1823 RepID=UPI001894E59F|nr:hypothetical protein [Nocardia otitidiscaviarum]MBF6238693.1 hypothetical protein [Nocardia otitidiscaviarum]
MAIHVIESLIRSDQTEHCARSVGQGAWVVSWLPGRTVTTEQAVAAVQLAEAVADLTDLARCLGLTPREAIGQAMSDPRPIDTRTPRLESQMRVGSM